MEEREQKTLAPPNLTSLVGSHTPPETLPLVEQAGVAKTRLTWVDLIVKSFLGGVFISLGSAFDLVVNGGSPGLRSSNPAMDMFVASFTFPIGFVVIILTSLEMSTSNMFVMAYAMLRRRITL